MLPDTLDRVRAIVAQFIKAPPETIDPETVLEDLSMDSLDGLEITFRLEEEFGVLIPNENASEFDTVRAICDGIEMLQRESRATSH